MKSGIDYFPLDVTLDSKMELIEAEFGLTGFGVVVKLLGEIYGKQGYYIEWTEEVALLFARRLGLGGNVVSEIVAASIKRGMFNQKIFNEYRILTSRGIQNRYFEAVSRRKEIEVEDNILLVDPTQICKNAYIKRKNVDILQRNADIYGQSRVEESRVKESKLEYRKAEESRGDGAAPAAGEKGFQDAVAAYRAQMKSEPSPEEGRRLEMFAAKLTEAVVLEAFRLSVERGADHWNYTKGILNDWLKNGIDSLEKVRREQEAFHAGRGNGRKSATGPTPGTPAANTESARRDIARIDALLGEMDGGKGL